VRSLKRFARTGNRTGLDSPKAKVACIVCGDTTVALKARFDGLGLLVFRVVILSVRVRLPDFDDRIRYRQAIAIENPSLENHSLA
jgi:hypothetical protein